VWWTVAVLVVVVAISAMVAVALYGRFRQPATVTLGLRPAGQVELPGDGSRFDYASLDPGRGLLFIAHLGASQVIEVDVHSQTVVRTIDGIAGVHGVLVIPEKRRVYATATDANRMVILDEDTGAQLASGPTGDYPDGLAFDPAHNTVWTTNESGGTETVLDADSAAVRGSVDLGGEVGNVAYDPTSRMMLVDVQAANVLAVVDPLTLSVVRRVGLPGCDHDHGLAIDPTNRLAFVACDGNAELLTVDLDAWQVTSHDQVGQQPDVLAFDPVAGRLFVASESGWVSLLTEHDRHLAVTGSGQLADNAHVVAVDPVTHRSYFPIAAGPGGKPTLLIFESP
jgi:DNA-binding beta-propeller fold protein YncE